MSNSPNNYREFSDSHLVELCRAGDAVAWRTIVNRYERLVYGIPRIFGLQYADADEVYQQVFASLHQSLNQLRDPDKLESWLSTTARRASLRLRRRERRQIEIKAEISRTIEDEGFVESADAEIERHQERERIRRAIEELGDPCTSLLLGLFASPPKSYRQMSRELGLAVGTLGSTRSRCIDRLKRKLKNLDSLIARTTRRQRTRSRGGRKP